MYSILSFNIFSPKSIVRNPVVGVLTDYCPIGVDAVMLEILRQQQKLYGRKRGGNMSTLPA